VKRRNLPNQYTKQPDAEPRKAASLVLAVNCFAMAQSRQSPTWAALFSAGALLIVPVNLVVLAYVGFGATFQA
jgi:hypothetical protein